MPQARQRPTERQPPVIVWLRDNLRLADNRALSAAAETGQPLLAIYVHDDASPGLRPLGGASRWWLHHSLAALGRDLAEAGAPLTHPARRSRPRSSRSWRSRSGRRPYSGAGAMAAAERAVDTHIKTSLGDARHRRAQLQ